ncbi:hypothetical protein H4S01_001875 [Coemansia sp. RSA 2610]|nr:hypothetical protein H4S01_001875 [Coemansia sp. RSA 2610]
MTVEAIVRDEEHSWSTIQDRLRASVVSIFSSQAIPFDTEENASSSATGFVVDAEQGIILSNRHVMHPGPSFHKATFFDNQEVFLQPTYYDPEHDFALFRYEPSELTGIEPRAIRLTPEKARSGLEIRVIGNDSSEKMSVLQGELSQLDRNVIDYGAGTYNDMNTFYYHASTSSKGGSSGSPVVDVAGDAVALNAGSAIRSSSSFFLPLQRVVYALEHVRQGRVPPRGTLQAVFRHVTHTEAARLGLDPGAAAAEGVDLAGTTGVLIVHKVLPAGPAAGVLRVGDIVVGVDGTAVPGFPELFGIVDTAVGRSIGMRVFRKGRFATLHATVQDLYEVTPARCLRIGFSFLHDLSFQEAAQGSAAVSGVKVSQDYGGLFRRNHFAERTVIHEINYQPTPSLDALMRVLRGVRRDQPLVVKVKDFKDPREEAVFVAHFPPVSPADVLFTRSSATGFWSTTPFDGVLPALQSDMLPDPASTRPPVSSSFAGRILQCMAWVDVRPVCPADGHFYRNLGGCGLVVDRGRGLVLCSARLVVNPTSNLSVTFGATRIAATLAYVHPLYPVAFVKYNPELLPADVVPDLDLPNVDPPNVDLPGVNLPGVDLANLDLSSPRARLRIGDMVSVLSGTQSALDRIDAAVSSRQLLSTTACGSCLNQRFYNTEEFSLSPMPPAVDADVGVVVKDERICGLWLCLPECVHDGDRHRHVGLDIALVLPALAQLRREDTTPAAVRVLDVEFVRQPIATARALGVSLPRLQQIMRTDPRACSMLRVRRILRVRTPDTLSLEVGDIVLEVNGRDVLHIDDVASFTSKAVRLTIVRQGRQLELDMPTTPFCGANTRRIIYWAGMYLQQPYYTVLAQATRLASDVYMFAHFNGAPIEATAYQGNTFINEIAEHPITTLDDVVRVIQLVKDQGALAEFNRRVGEDHPLRSGTMPGRDVTIRTVLLNGDDAVKSVRTNDLYFGPWQLTRGSRIDDHWTWEQL